MKSDKGELSRYVRRVMKEKSLTQRDVEVNSGGGITDGYVADILSGDARNPSIEKIAALARGLDVNPYELFDIACGPLEKSAAARQTVSLPPVVPFLEMMLEVADSPELMKLMEEAIQLRPEERAVLLLSAETLNGHKQKSQHGKRSQRSKDR